MFRLRKRRANTYQPQQTPTPKNPKKKGKKRSSLLAGLDAEAIIELDDEDDAAAGTSIQTLVPSSTQHHHTTRTRHKGRIDSEALYSSKYHPLDDVKGFRRGRKCTRDMSSSPMKVDSDSDSDDTIQNGSDDKESDIGSNPADEDQSPTDTQRKKDPRATRVSGRSISQKFVNYSQKVHPQDEGLRNAGAISRHRGKGAQPEQSRSAKRKKVEKASLTDGARDDTTEEHSVDLSSPISGKKVPRHKKILYVAEDFDYLHMRRGEFYFPKKEDSWYSGPELRKGDRNRYANDFQSPEDESSGLSDPPSLDTDTEAEQLVQDGLAGTSFGPELDLDEDARAVSPMDEDGDTAAVDMMSNRETDDLDEEQDEYYTQPRRTLRSSGKRARFVRELSVADSEPERLSSQIHERLRSSPELGSFSVDVRHSLQEHSSQHGVSMAQLMLDSDEDDPTKTYHESVQGLPVVSSVYSVGQPPSSSLPSIGQLKSLSNRTQLRRQAPIGVHEDLSEPLRTTAHELYTAMVNVDASEKENLYGPEDGDLAGIDEHPLPTLAHRPVQALQPGMRSNRDQNVAAQPQPSSRNLEEERANSESIGSASNMPEVPVDVDAHHLNVGSNQPNPLVIVQREHTNPVADSEKVGKHAAPQGDASMVPAPSAYILDPEHTAAVTNSTAPDSLTIIAAASTDLVDANLQLQHTPRQSGRQGFRSFPEAQSLMRNPTDTPCPTAKFRGSQSSLSADGMTYVPGMRDVLHRGTLFGPLSTVGSQRDSAPIEKSQPTSDRKSSPDHLSTHEGHANKNFPNCMAEEATEPAIHKDSRSPSSPLNLQEDILDPNTVAKIAEAAAIEADLSRTSASATLLEDSVELRGSGSAEHPTTPPTETDQAPSSPIHISRSQRKNIIMLANSKIAERQAHVDYLFQEGSQASQRSQ